MVLKVRTEGIFATICGIDNQTGVKVYSAYWEPDGPKNKVFIVRGDGDVSEVFVHPANAYIDKSIKEVGQATKRELFESGSRGDASYNIMKALENKNECYVAAFYVDGERVEVTYNDKAYLCNDRGQTIDVI